MCLTKFAKILVGDDKMVLCRGTDLIKVGARTILRKAFPELFENRRFWDFFRSVDYRIESCYKMYSSHFDVQVRPLENGHDWDKTPFIALRVFSRDGVTYCSATPIDLSV